jgi:hypothetical protein
MSREFITHMQGKFPELDIETITDLVDKNVAEIKPNPENPDQSVKIFPGSDLNKNIIIKIISEYLESQQKARKFYYTVDIDVADFGDDVLECTGSKLVTIYEIINNEPQQMELIGMDLGEDAEQEVREYMAEKHPDVNPEVDRL